MRRGARVALPLLALLLLAGCKTELFTSLAEGDANEILALLQTNGLSATKMRQKDGLDTLAVEQGQFARAVALLRDAGLPRKSFQSMGDVFQSTGLVASPMQERARFIWALGQELSRTISDIDGVITARVQVVLPNNDLLNRDPTPSSASVFVRYDSTSAVDRLVPQIKQLVANSVEGLSYDKVSVVLVPAAAARSVTEPAPPVDAYAGLDARIGVFAVLAALAACAWAAATRLSRPLRWPAMLRPGSRRPAPPEAAE
ncbi:MAG: type III secretion system inner membrane ring lipoprotein SctJ [Janthinobacterium lividum]